MKIPTLEQVVAMMQEKYMKYVEIAYAPPPDWLDVERDGAHPKIFYLFQFEPAANQLAANCDFSDRVQLAAWLLEREKITPLDPTMRSWEVFIRHSGDPANDSRKMFWSYGIAQFAYNEANGLLEDAYNVGSLNGRGFVSQLQFNEQGEIEIIEPRMAWIS